MSFWVLWTSPNRSVEATPVLTLFGLKFSFNYLSIFFVAARLWTFFLSTSLPFKRFFSQDRKTENWQSTPSSFIDWQSNAWKHVQIVKSWEVVDENTAVILSSPNIVFYKAKRPFIVLTLPKTLEPVVTWRVRCYLM